MKISVDIDCTPEEARRLLGLPDVAALNETLTTAMQEKLAASVASFDADAAARTWFESALGGMERMQQAFFAQMQPGAAKKD